MELVKPTEMKPLGRPRRRWRILEPILKVPIREIGLFRLRIEINGEPL